jgi:hypothetical protein
MRSALAIGAATALAVAASATAAAPNHRIDPGAIAGGTLGASAARYSAIYGPPSITTRFPGPTTRLAFEGGEVQVFLQKGRGVALLAVSDEYKTTRGVGPCSLKQAVVRAYGRRLTPMVRGAARRVVAYRLGRLVFGVVAGRVSGVMLTDQPNTHLSLLLTAAPCGKGDED